MKLLHTADWHLGQTLAGHERTHEHRLFLQWLLRTLQERQIDALLIAGDVFDQASPPAQAQALYYDFLAQARRAARAAEKTSFSRPPSLASSAAYSASSCRR